MTRSQLKVHGIDPREVDALVTSGHDVAGNPVEAFDDVKGGWPLRCCLRLSQVGDRLAIVS